MSSPRPVGPQGGSPSAAQGNTGTGRSDNNAEEAGTLEESSISFASPTSNTDTIIHTPGAAQDWTYSDYEDDYLNSLDNINREGSPTSPIPAAKNDKADDHTALRGDKAGEADQPAPAQVTEMFTAAANSLNTATATTKPTKAGGNVLEVNTVLETNTHLEQNMSPQAVNTRVSSSEASNTSAFERMPETIRTVMPDDASLPTAENRAVICAPAPAYAPSSPAAQEDVPSASDTTAVNPSIRAALKIKVQAAVGRAKAITQRLKCW